MLYANFCPSRQNSCACFTANKAISCRKIKFPVSQKSLYFFLHRRTMVSCGMNICWSFTRPADQRTKISLLSLAKATVPTKPWIRIGPTSKPSWRLYHLSLLINRRFPSKPQTNPESPFPPTAVLLKSQFEVLP